MKLSSCNHPLDLLACLLQTFVRFWPPKGFRIAEDASRKQDPTERWNLLPVTCIATAGSEAFRRTPIVTMKVSGSLVSDLAWDWRMMQQLFMLGVIGAGKGQENAGKKTVGNAEASQSIKRIGWGSR